MQLGPISTSALDVVIVTSLVSPVETRQVRKVDLNWTYFFCSHENRTVRYRTASFHTRTERYDIVSFQFLIHFPVPPNFWTCFGTDRLSFPYPRECNPSMHHFLEWTGVERYDILPVRTGPCLTSQPLKSDKNSLIYTNLKIESRSKRGRILSFLGDQFLELSDAAYAHLRQRMIKF